MSTSWDSEDSFWKRTTLYSAIAVAVVAAGGAIYYFEFMKKPEAAVAPPAAQAPAAAPAAEEKEHHPIASAPDKPLPKLNESDSELASALGGVFGKGPIDQMLVPEMVIRHIVVTVDNLPRNKVAEQMRPLKSLGGETVVVYERGQHPAQRRELGPVRGADEAWFREWTSSSSARCTSAITRCSSRPTRISATPGSTSTTGWSR